MKNKLTLLALTLLAFTLSVCLTACTTASKDIAAAEVTPAHYQGLNCPQLNLELQEVQTKSAEVAQRLDDGASKDRLNGIVGGTIFFPALFWVGGNSLLEHEYAALKGRLQALQQAISDRRCSSSTYRSPPAGQR